MRAVARNGVAVDLVCDCCGAAFTATPPRFVTMVIRLQKGTLI
jgi:hypothetical protein